MAVYSRSGEKITSKSNLSLGTVIEMERKARKEGIREFRKKLGLRPRDYRGLVNNIDPITAELALKIEQIWGIDAEFFMKVQMNYQLRIERLKIA